MKGGSITAVLLDTIFLSALQTLLELSVTSAAITSRPSNTRTEERAREKSQELVFQHCLPPSLSPVTDLLDCYAATYRAVYRHAVGVASLMSLAASCLCQPSGRLVYLGADTLGALGSVSLSVCLSVDVVTKTSQAVSPQPDRRVRDGGYVWRWSGRDPRVCAGWMGGMQKH